MQRVPSVRAPKADLTRDLAKVRQQRAREWGRVAAFDEVRKHIDVQPIGETAGKEWKLLNWLTGQSEAAMKRAVELGEEEVRLELELTKRTGSR
jgi:hypothetical protein